jgi:hypothetical protein
MADRRITLLGKNLYQEVPWYDDDGSKRTEEVMGEPSALTELGTSFGSHVTNWASARRVSRYSPADSLQYLQHRRGSIWAEYKRCFELELNGKVDVAVPRSTSQKLFVVRRAATSNLNRQLHMLVQLMAQPYFAKCFQVFGSVSSPYFVCEYLNLTLGHILGLPTFPTEVEVAAIAGQVRYSTHICLQTDGEQLLQALTFLEQHNLAHQRLSMSNILLSDDGHVKIGRGLFSMGGNILWVSWLTLI